MCFALLAIKIINRDWAFYKVFSNHGMRNCASKSRFAKAHYFNAIAGGKGVQVFQDFHDVQCPNLIPIFLIFYNYLL